MAISNNSTGLRPGVCTSTTRPTAPYEGQMIYETDTDKTLFWDGSAWANVNSVSPTFTGTPIAPTATVGTNTTQLATTAFANAAGGLVYITGNTFSITNAAPLNLDNVFTSTYDNYLLTTQNVTSASGTTSVILQWRVSGITTTSGYFFAYQGLTSVGGTYNTNNNGSGAGIDVALAETASGSGSSVMNLMTPKTTGQPAAYGQLFAQGPGYYVTRQGGGALNAGTDFDGFTLRASASTITGSYTLYGYRKT